MVQALPCTVQVFDHIMRGALQGRDSREREREFYVVQIFFKVIRAIFLIFFCTKDTPHVIERCHVSSDMNVALHGSRLTCDVSKFPIPQHLPEMHLVPPI